MLTEQEILEHVAHAAQAILDDSDLALDAPLGAATALNRDLCLSSVEVLELFAMLDVKLGRRLPYDQLVLRAGQYRTELTIGELARFAWQRQDACADIRDQMRDQVRAP